jgi:NADH-quinone oxidoreductase subunit G
VAMAVRRGKHDDFLIKAEKAANARGVRELGLVKGENDGLDELLRACEDGEVKALYVCGDDLLDVVALERLEGILARIELLIVQDLKLRPQFGRATIVLPTTTFAEKDGTFTNHAGRVQRIQRALATPPGWVADGEIFTAILNLVGSRGDRFELGEVWAAMTRDGGAFAGLKLDEIGPNGAALAVPGGR